MASSRPLQYFKSNPGNYYFSSTSAKSLQKLCGTTTVLTQSRRTCQDIYKPFLYFSSTAPEIYDISITSSDVYRTTPGPLQDHTALIPSSGTFQDLSRPTEFLLQKQSRNRTSVVSLKCLYTFTPGRLQNKYSTNSAVLDNYTSPGQI